MSSVKSRFTQIVEQCLRNGISDLHLAGGHSPVLRKDGRLHLQKQGGFTPGEMDDLVKTLATKGQLAMLRERWSVDMGISLAGARLRINIFATPRSLSMAVRFLPGRIPDFESLNLHPSLNDFSKIHSGLVLICGSTGSGKTTTIAAMLEAINKERPAHVITLEDPIEYRFVTRQAFVEQRELGTHFQSYEQGLLDVLREAPDVIMVGELREAPTIRLTLNAAESGHLVIATLHASSAEEVLFRLFNAFPPESQNLVRHQVSSSLAGIIIQRLEFLPAVGFQVPTLSILRTNSAIRGLIREGRTAQLESTLEMGRKEMMFTFDRYRNEFLGPNRRLTPPTASFRPSREIMDQDDHASPLLDMRAGAREGRPESQADQQLTAQHDGMEEIEQYLTTLNGLGEVGE